MFFYRPWVRTPSDDDLFNKPVDFMNIYNYERHSWGYGVLLGLTMVLSLVLNSSFLLSFWTWPNQRKHAPSIVLLMFSIRDLLVTIFLMPTMISWLIVESGTWMAGGGWCTVSGFLDFFLAAEYPFLILCLCVVCITRKLTKYYDDFFDPALDEEDDHRKVDEYIQSIPTASVPGVTVVGTPNGSRAPSLMNHPINPKYPSSPPSISGFSDSSRGKRRLTPGGGFHYSNKAASISGGSVHRGANYLKPPPHNFRASSLLREEVASVDLWEEASLGYPGKQCPSIRNREIAEFEEEDDESGPPTFHTWHFYLAGFTWVISLSFGISAAFYMKYFDNKRTCMLIANPFLHHNVLMDPGFNYLFSNVILTYLVPMAIFLVLLVFLYLKRTKNAKFRRYIKVILAVFVVFFISRTPIDKLQLQGLIYAYNGTKLLTVLPYELEHEILIIWTMFIPTFLNPIIFMGFISEYRSGALIGWKILGGCYHSKKPKRSEIINKANKRDVEVDEKEEEHDESMTKESEFL